MNDRVTCQAQAEAIGVALAMLPPRMRERVGHAAFHTVDPLFSGLFAPGHDEEHPTIGASYRRAASVSYRYHLGHRPADQRRTTVALPTFVKPDVIVHELGHVLHEAIGFEDLWDGRIVVVTDYADHSYAEAFAEAFTVWAIPRQELMRSEWAGGFEGSHEILARSGAEVVALFEELAR